MAHKSKPTPSGLDFFNWSQSGDRWRVWIGPLRVVIERVEGYWRPNIVVMGGLAIPPPTLEKMRDILRKAKWSNGKFRSVEKAKINALQAARYIVTAMQGDLDRLEASLLKQTHKVGRR